MSVHAIAHRPSFGDAPAPRAARPSRAHRGVALAMSAAMLASCANLTRESRIGADDGTDACRTQLVALDSTGNFFAEDILRGAALGALGGAAIGGLASGNWRGALIGAGIGAAAGAAGGYLAALQQRNQDQASLGAALASDLDRENAELLRTQQAFDQLMDCRFRSAATIRAAAREGRMPRDAAQAQLAALRDRTRRDIELAQFINGRVNQRGAEFDTAIEAVAPGTKAMAQASRAVPTRTASVGRAVPIRLRPDAGAPEIGALASRQSVTVRPARAGFLQVETADGQRGYVPAEAVSGAGGGGRGGARMAAAPAEPVAVPGDVRSLAATNIARRDSFSDSVTQAQSAAAGGGFELAS